LILLNIILFVLSCLLLFKGADYLIDNSRILVEKFSVSPIVVGATVVALGTSLPELIVSTIFSFSGESLKVYGNIVGSNIANISLALGIVYVISDFNIYYVKVKRDILFLIFTTLIFCFLIISNFLDMRFGFILLFLFLIYLLSIITESKKENNSINNLEISDNRYLILIGFGIVLLSSGSFLFDYSSNQIANYFNLGDMILGVTLIAIGTSAPEIITSIVSVRKKESGFVIGNVIGSNLMNILLVIATSSIVSKINILEISYNNLYTHSMLLLGTVLFLYSQLKVKLSNKMLDGYLLIILYFVFVFFTYNYT